MRKVLTFLIVAGLVVFGLYKCGSKILYGKIISAAKTTCVPDTDVSMEEMLHALCTDEHWAYAPTEDAPFVKYTGTLRSNGKKLEVTFYMVNVFDQLGALTSGAILDGEEVDGKLAEQALYMSYIKQRK